MKRLLIDALAAYRLTKLVVDDQLTAEIRDGVIEAAYVAAGRSTYDGPADDRPGAWADHVAQDPDPPKLAFLVTCPHCAGMWVAFGVVAIRRILPRAWRPLAEALAISTVTGLIADHLME